MPSLLPFAFSIILRVTILFTSLSGLLFYLAALSPFLPLSSAYNFARWSLLASTLFLLCFSYLLGARNRLPNTWSHLSIKVLLSFTLVMSFLSTSVVMSAASVNSYLFWGWEVLFVLAVVAFGCALGDRIGELESLFSVIRIVSVLAFCVMGLYSLTIIIGFSFWYAGVPGQLRDFVPYGFYNIRFWSHMATWLLPLAIFGMGEMRQQQKKVVYFAFLLISALWVVAALSSGARGHFLALVLAGFVLWVFCRKKVMCLVMDGLTAFLLGLAFYLFFVMLIPAVFLDGGDAGRTVLRAGASGRMLLWQLGLENSIENFPFGQGALSYSREATVSPLATPHSVYIRWAAEYGWMALVAFIGAIILWIYPLLRWVAEGVVDTDIRPVLAILWSSFAAAIHGAVSGVFSSPHSLLVGVPVLVILVALARTIDAKHSSMIYSADRRRHLLLPIILIGLAMLSPTYDWYRASLSQAQEYMEQNGVPLGARFWLHGRYVD